MDAKRRLTLATQFNLVTIALILATSLGITFFVVREEANSNREELIDFGQSTAAMMAQNCEFAIYTRDTRAIRAILEGIEKNPDIVYTAVIDAEKHLLKSHTKTPLVTLPAIPPAHYPTAPGQFPYREFVSPQDGREYIDVLAPVVSQPQNTLEEFFTAGKSPPRIIGYLQLGLSVESRNRNLWDFIRSAAQATSILVLAGVGLTLLVTRRIAAPIRKLVEFTRSVSEEKLDHHIRVGGSAEIVDLSKSFNQMLSRLKTYRDQLEERNVALADANRRETEIRRQAEEERDLLGMAVEQAAETILITDTEGTIQYVNPAFEKVSGYRRDEVIGRNPRFLKSDRHDPDHYQAMWNTLTQGEVWTGSFINKHKDGSLFEEIAVISPVRNTSGQIVNFVAVKRDITREVQMEEQLRQSQKMEAIGKLTGGIAHDFNNLLTIITGYGEILLHRLAPNDPGRREIEEIKKASDRAAAMTRQLLAFSRKQILQPKVLDLNQVISGMGKMLKRLIGEDIDLVTNCTKEVWKVKVDPGQIEQVILNLAVNARDAMPGGGKLTLETANVELDDTYVRKHPVVKPGPYVMLAVSDSGSGMDKQTLSRIFEPFYTTKEPGKGTGLGLSTVYGIVKQSRGHIWVYSEPGQGAIFKVYFPRVEELDEQVSEAEEPSYAKWAGSETLLLAEDEESVRNLVRSVLEQNGYTVLEAQDGREAMKVCHRHEGPIHLVMTDVVMPQMSGRKLATLLGEVRPGMKALFMSGYTENAIVHHGVLDAGTAFLQKPFRTDAMLRKVREVLDSPGFFAKESPEST